MPCWQTSSRIPYCALITSLLFTVLNPSHATPSTEVGATPGTVLPFVIAKGEPASAGPCPAKTTAVLKAVTEEEQAQVVEAIRQAMLASLDHSDLARLVPGADGSLTFAGCIVRMEAGSKAKRVIGMTMGASYLGAHVKVTKRQAGSDLPVREYDLEIKGDNAAPPVFGGAIYNAVHNKKVSIEADATKLGTQAIELYLKPSAQTAADKAKAGTAP